MNGVLGMHTPSPWTVEEYGDEDAPALVIHRDSETRVCFMAAPGSHGDPAKIEADARLITAAPDGLLLANLVVEYFGERPIDQMDTDQRLFDIATGIIAKARGS